MPLHTPTVPALRHPRLARVAAVVAALSSTAGVVTIGTADDRPASQTGASTESMQPAAARYLDIEANKANSMRALGLHIARQRADAVPR